MSQKKDKEDLREPDVFVSTSDKVFNFVEHHFKTFVGGVGLLFLAGVVYVAWGYMSAHREQVAAEALYSAESELKKAQAPVALDLGKPVAKPPESEDYGKKYAPLVEKLEAQLRGHSDTKAALVSGLNLSYFLMQQKQYQEALKVLDLIKYRPNSSELLAGFWYMHRGLVLLENGQLDQAMEAYQSVLHSPSLKSFYPEAWLKTGVAYELKGDLSKARETYEKLGREFPETEAAQSAQQFMRALQMKTPQQG